MSRLYDGLRSANDAEPQPVALDEEALKDLRWWREFLPRWSATSMMIRDEAETNNDLHLHTDATPWCCAACFGNEWFRYDFTEEEKRRHITWKEARAVTLEGARALSILVCELHVRVTCVT